MKQDELIDTDDELVKAYVEFKEHRRQFLDAEMQRFFEVYQHTKSSKAHKTYQQLLKERQRC